MANIYTAVKRSNIDIPFWNSTHPIFEEFANIVRKDVVVIAHADGKGAVTTPTGKFNIRIGAYPSTAKKVPGMRSPKKLFGVELHSSDEVFCNPQIGKEVKDSKGNVAAVLVGNTLFVLVRVNAWDYDYTAEPEMFFSFLLKATAKLLVAEETIEKRREEFFKTKMQNARKAYGDLCITSRANEISQAEYQVTQAQARKENARKAYIQSMAQLRDYEDRVELLKARDEKGVKRERIEQEFDKIAAFPGIEAVWIENRSIVILTETLLSQKLKDNSRRILGKMKLVIPTDGEPMKVSNLTKLVHGLPHPHADEDGQLCLGNIEEGIYDMIGAFDLAPAVNVMLEYLRTANEADANGVRVYQWPKVRQKK